MRIVGGRNRSRLLQTPAGVRTRPTGERVRESVFDILTPRVQGARVLDLFCGSGALALEALSRGAASAVLADRDPRAIRAARTNIASLGYDAVTQTLCADWRRALRTLAALSSVFDLVFLDPPYHMADSDAIAAELAAHDLLAANATVIAEHDKGRPPDYNEVFVLTDRRIYGNTGVSFYCQKEE